MSTRGEKRDKGSEEIFEVIIAKFPKLTTGTKSQNEEAQTTLNRIKQRKQTITKQN